MKKSKKTVALIAAVLMTVTMFTGTITANAATQSKSAILKCAGYNSRCSLISENNRSAKASTVCLVHKYPYIYAAILCAKYNKNTDKTTYVSSSPKEGHNAYSSGEASMSAPSSAAEYYANIVSMHVVKEGSDEQGTSLDVHW